MEAIEPLGALITAAHQHFWIAAPKTPTGDPLLTLRPFQGLGVIF